MDPSEEKKEKKKAAQKNRSYVLPAVLLLILLGSIGGIYLFLNSSSPPPLALPEPVAEEAASSPAPTIVPPESDSEPEITEPSAIQEETLVDPADNIDSFENSVLPAEKEQQLTKPAIETVEKLPEPEENPAIQEEQELTTACSEPEKQLDLFYSHLDKQPYIQAYNLQESSEVHFEKLIQKLLANPPKVTRESDDLYTILRNTAHFFRISGKDNILMLKGILNSEKAALEQILADYYFLITTPECIHSKYAKNINGDALYEYACFFLNTMGGRLYLFRRDSESRMVVTYYAILLVDQANRQQNNRHGIALKSAINMLISEMESGGSKMKGAEDYLDILYDLKEEYQ